MLTKNSVPCLIAGLRGRHHKALVRVVELGQLVVTICSSCHKPKPGYHVLTLLDVFEDLTTKTIFTDGKFSGGISKYINKLIKGLPLVGVNMAITSARFGLSESWNTLMTAAEVCGWVVLVRPAPARPACKHSYLNLIRS